MLEYSLWYVDMTLEKKMKKIPYTEWLITERRRRGWTQLDLAQASDLSPRTIYTAEAGKTPKQKTFKKIIRAFHENPSLLPENVSLMDSVNSLEIPPAMGLGPQEQEHVA